jgi:acyl-CoA dehydrogenase
MTLHPFYTEEHEAFRSTIREFVDRELKPNVDAWDEAGEFPRGLYEKAGRIGLLGAGFPERYGGLGNEDVFTRLIIDQEMARSGSGGLMASLVGSFYISQPPILRLGSEELKSRILPETISGRKIGALAISEPGAGSDVAALSTSAARDGDDYVVNGSKTFITSGMRADYYTVAVRTGGAGMGGISLLVIERDRPGFSRTPLQKMGWWCSDTATLYFEDCRVPAGNLLGDENTGFRAIVSNFNLERLDMVAGSTAFARLCLEEALAYARERRTFGRRLADHQVIRHKLVEMARHVNATQALLEMLAWRLDRGDNPVAEICQAKVQATLCFELCAREAAQILGGASYLRGHIVERLYREVRVQAIGGGSEEIMRDLAARQMGI